MATIKPGDVVWVRAEIIMEPVEALVEAETGATEYGFYAVGSAWWRAIDNETLDDDNSGDHCIPDSPALPAVAALLDEPGLAAAVETLLSLTKHLPATDEDGWAAAGLCERLAAALNGGTDGND